MTSSQYIKELELWHTRFFAWHWKRTATGGKFLDFGTGFGVAVYCAKALGIDCVGLDIGDEFITDKSYKRRDDYKTFQKEKGIEKEILQYNGKKMPFKANTFDHILFRKSINKDFSMTGNYSVGITNEELRDHIQKRIKELARISAKNCNWLIYPWQHFEFAKKLDLKALEAKKIKLIKVGASGTAR